MNKYYLGALHIARSVRDKSNNAHTMETLEEAIDAAKKRVLAGEDCVIIVEIIRIVRRQENPIIVEIV